MHYSADNELFMVSVYLLLEWRAPTRNSRRIQGKMEHLGMLKHVDFFLEVSIVASTRAHMLLTTIIVKSVE